MSKYKETVIRLLESDITGYQIWKDTNVSQHVISQIRRGKRDVENLTLSTAEKLYNYQKELEVMKNLENKIIKLDNENDVELVDSLGQFFTEIENDNNGRYNVEYVLLNEVEYDNEKTYYEVQINRTEEVEFRDILTDYTINSFYDEWLNESQRGETYIESIFFENEEDAKEYIKLVLKGYDNLHDMVKSQGYLKSEPKTYNEMRLEALKNVKDEEVDINVYNVDDELYSLNDFDEEYLEKLKEEFKDVDFKKPFFIIDRIGGPIFDVIQASDVNDFRSLVEIANRK